MPDMEKVIKELESLRDICNAKSNMATGNGKVAWTGYANAADDAIALLKEQEAVEPNPVHNSSRWFACGKCDCSITREDRFCPRCGQAVKWE